MASITPCRLSIFKAYPKEYAWRYSHRADGKAFFGRYFFGRLRRRDFAGFPSGAAAFFRSRRKSLRLGTGIAYPLGVFCVSLMG